MSERREFRYPIDQDVEITVLGPPDVSRRCRIRNASGRGLGLELDTALATGAAVKIALRDAILLGEVIYCRLQAGVWNAGVELEHALYGLAGLAAIMGKSSAADSGSECQDTVHYTSCQHE